MTKCVEILRLLHVYIFYIFNKFFYVPEYDTLVPKHVACMYYNYYTK